MRYGIRTFDGNIKTYNYWPYQLREMLSVRLRRRGVLNRSTRPYLRSDSTSGGPATAVVTSFPSSCSWRLAAGLTGSGLLLKAWPSCDIVKPCTGMASALPFWINILRMMALASLYRPWEKSQRGDSSTNLCKQSIIPTES